MTPAPGARLAVEGTLNLRDIGGYETVDGRHVRRGRLFRSDHLNEVTDAGFGVLADLGLRTVLDLRLQNERESQPSRLPAGVDVRNVNPLGAAGASQHQMMDDIRSGRVTSITDADMAGMYLTMLTDAGEMFAAVVRVAGRPDDLPALFHCTAGKDRTGVAAAVLLRLLGVPDEVILADFALTNEYRTAPRIAQMTPEFDRMGLDITNFLALFGAPESAMRAALEWIDDRGGVEAYLTDVCALGPDDLAAARAEMLVSIP